MLGGKWMNTCVDIFHVFSKTLHRLWYIYRYEKRNLSIVLDQYHFWRGREIPRCRAHTKNVHIYDNELENHLSINMPSYEYMNSHYKVRRYILLHRSRTFQGLKVIMLTIAITRNFWHITDRFKTTKRDTGLFIVKFELFKINNISIAINNVYCSPSYTLLGCLSTIRNESWVGIVNKKWSCLFADVNLAIHTLHAFWIEHVMSWFLTTENIGSGNGLVPSATSHYLSQCSNNSCKRRSKNCPYQGT